MACYSPLKKPKIELTSDALRDILNKAPKGTAGGHDNMPIDILKQIFFWGTSGGRKDNTLANLLAKWISQVFINGEADDEVTTFWFGGRTNAILTTPTKLRPISAPSEYRKAAGRYINSIVREDENIAFENIQFGVGKPFGGRDYCTHYAN